MADLYTPDGATVDPTKWDDSQVTLLSKAFHIAASDNLVVNDVATVRENINAKAIDIVKYSKLDPTTTALTESAEVGS